MGEEFPYLCCFWVGYPNVWFVCTYIFSPALCESSLCLSASLSLFLSHFQRFPSFKVSLTVFELQTFLKCHAYMLAMVGEIV